MTEARRRPPDRRDRIAVAASRLFADEGYEQVTIGQIAAAVDITGRAIYRHYDSKYDLLARTVSDGLGLLEGSVAADSGDEDDTDGALRRAYSGLVQVALERRGFCVLVVREARHLEAPDRRERDRRMEGVIGRLSVLLRCHRPDLDAEGADLLVRFSLAVLTSTSFHHTSIAFTEAEPLLTAMVQAVLTAPVAPFAAGHTTRTGSTDRPLVQASKREALLVAAAELFGSEGFPAVRLEDIGARVGIAGPSIYQYFSGKPDLLLAALTRGVEVLQAAQTTALMTAASPEDALEEVVRSYVDFSLRQPDLMRVFLDEVVHLASGDRRNLRRRQREYAVECVRLLRTSRPDLSEAAGHLTIHAALQLANEVARNDTGRTRDDISSLLPALMNRVLRVM